MQALRPEVSASLAAVIDRATAKDLHERYRSDEELIADLEDVLALEAARAGSATGEATTVLRTLPEQRAPAAAAARAQPAGVAGGRRRCCDRRALVRGDRAARRPARTAARARTGPRAASGARRRSRCAPTPRRTTTRSATTPSTPDRDGVRDRQQTRRRSGRPSPTRPATCRRMASASRSTRSRARSCASCAIRTPTPGFAAEVYVAGRRRSVPETVPDRGLEARRHGPLGRVETDDRPRHRRPEIHAASCSGSRRSRPASDRVEISELSLYR